MLIKISNCVGVLLFSAGGRRVPRREQVFLCSALNHSLERLLENDDGAPSNVLINSPAFKKRGKRRGNRSHFQVYPQLW